MRLMTTKHGLIALHQWRDYVSDGLHTNSMRSIAQKTGAKAVLLIADEVNIDELTVETIEAQVDAIIASKDAT